MEKNKLEKEAGGWTKYEDMDKIGMDKRDEYNLLKSCFNIYIDAEFILDNSGDIDEVEKYAKSIKDRILIEIIDYFGLLCE